MGMRIDDPALEARARQPRFRGFEGMGASPDGTEGVLVSAAGENPFCGDELEVRLALRPGEEGPWVVDAAAFDGYGCTLCLAAADAVMEHVVGLPVAEAAQVDFDATCALIGGLEVGRTRRGCVDLVSRVVRAALATEAARVSLQDGLGEPALAKDAVAFEENAVDKQRSGLAY